MSKHLLGGMKVLPYYKEDEGAKCPSSISLVENLNFLSTEDAQVISAYMESCVVIDEWLSNIKDPISGRLDIPSKTWSDGQFVWDSSHIHYVRKYRVRLPSVFVEHVKNQVSKKFDVNALIKSKLREGFEAALKKTIAGDDSPYAAY
ncbi:hypothetical protein [Chitinimonas prasina]|nr:hypothetical protein [Chitinimonas prasina]